MSTEPDKKARIPSLPATTLISGLSMISALFCITESAPLKFELRGAANQDCICAFAIRLPVREALLAAESR
jgi:hypothetical protein